MASRSDPHELDGNIPGKETNGESNITPIHSDEDHKNHTAASVVTSKILAMSPESLEILEHKEHEMADIHNLPNQDGNLYVNEFEKDVVVLLGLCDATANKEAGADDKFDDQEMSSIVNETYENGSQEDNKNDVQQSIVASAHDENIVKGSSSGSHELCTNENGQCLAGSLEDLTIDLQSVESDVDQPIVASTGSPIPETRCIGHYNNQQKILLVGEGDFSFASSLATAFGDASSLTATSLDTKDVLIYRYSKAGKNLKDLQRRGVLVIHQVDVHTMDENIQLEHKLFDRIVFNFPHFGDVYGRKCKEGSPWYITYHQYVVEGFFETARRMLTQDGEIHVTHKTNDPFDRWNIVDLAEEAELELISEVFFNILDYPGYENKKAFRECWDSTFPVGECYTFMFSRKI